MRSGLIVVLAASTALLAGCATVAQPAQPARPARPVDGPTSGQYYQERWMDILTIVPNLYPPKPTAVRTVQQSDWLETIVACVNVYGLPPGEPNAYAISELVCEIQYPSANGFELYRTADDRARLYDYYENSLLPCLTLMGQKILPSPAYRTALSADRFLWPVNGPVVLGPTEQYRLDRCPVPPSGLASGS